MSCQASNYFTDIHQGDTFTGRKMVIYDGVGDTKVVKDLTDYDFVIDFKTSENSSVAFSFSTLDGTITIPNPLNGEIFMQARDMDYKKGRYIFDFVEIHPSGAKKELFSNSWNII